MKMPVLPQEDKTTLKRDANKVNRQERVLHPIEALFFII